MAENMLPCLIADSAAFLKCAPLQNMANRIFTVTKVIDEIRDSATRQRLAVLPYKIEFREPSTEAIKTVSDFAKKTGDFPSLSAVDVKVLALTYQLEKEFCDSEHIREQPLHKVECLHGSGMVNPGKIAGFFTGKHKSDSVSDKDEEQVIPEEQDEERIDDARNDAEKKDVALSDVQEDAKMLDDSEKQVHANEAHDGEDEIPGEENEMCRDSDDNDGDDDVDDDADDDEGWITPNNISKMKKMMGADEAMDNSDLEVKCACLTTDFAMQNVLLQMGLHIVSVDGMLIKQARTYILKCFGCNKETTQMDRVFCKNCGNKTLRKVSVGVNHDGTLQYFFPRRRRPVNIRGTKFSIPLPKGGRHASNVVLTEDQSQTRQRLPKTRDSANPLDPDYIARSSPFLQKDVTSKAFNKGIHLKQNTRKNPNEGRRTKSRRK